MRVPHTVPRNALRAYEPSEQTLALMGERLRRLRSENWSWDENTIPSLVEECIRFFVTDFDEHKRVLPFMEDTDVLLVLETLPTSLSLNIVIPLIPDGIYWERRCLDTWSTMNDVSRYESSWKRMFTERFIKDLVESEEPGYTDWTEVGELLSLCSLFVKRLEISQLQPPRIMESVPIAPDLCNTNEFVPEHLDLSPVLKILENLEELDIQFGIKDIGMKFTFTCFRIHVNDIQRLAKGLSQSKKLKKLRITCSDIDDVKLNIILRSLENCDFFEELEIAHCKITDVGAKSIGHFLTIKTTLKHLKLQNNFIKSEGAQALAYALSAESSIILETLELKFNLIGDEGGRYLATALAKSKNPFHLIVAGCGLGQVAGLDFVNMLMINKTLISLDVSNNALGEEVGHMMVKALENNHALLNIDVRNCGFIEDCENTIHGQTFRNREKVRKCLPGSIKESRKHANKRKDTSSIHSHFAVLVPAYRNNPA